MRQTGRGVWKPTLSANKLQAVWLSRMIILHLCSAMHPSLAILPNQLAPFQKIKSFPNSQQPLHYRSSTEYSPACNPTASMRGQKGEQTYSSSIQNSSVQQLQDKNCTKVHSTVLPGKLTCPSLPLFLSDGGSLQPRLVHSQFLLHLLQKLLLLLFIAAAPDSRLRHVPLHLRLKALIYLVTQRGCTKNQSS